ncbi:MAG: cytochrome P450 [bacterium]|nr:cytochrome P450 [bacterium]
MNNLPRHKGVPIFKSTFPLLGDLLGFPLQQSQKLGKVFRADVLLGPLIYVFDSNWITHVLETHPHNYIKSRQYDPLKFALGNGLLTSDGDEWKAQRKVLQPMFMKDSIATLCKGIEQGTASTINRWKHKTEIPHLNHETNLLAIDIASRCFFGIEAKERGARLAELIEEINHFLMRYLKIPIPIPLSTPLPFIRRFKAARKEVYQLINEVRHMHNNGELASDNMISMLIDSGQFDDELVRDEIITFMAAGHETSSNALTFTLFALLNNPEHFERVKDECRALNLSQLSVDTLKDLPYTVAAIKESLRLYPPAWTLGRRNLEEDVIQGHTIKRDTNIIIPTYAIHRHPEFWPNPDTYDPMRFFGKSERDFPKFTYLPFGGGPRFCIGQHFAMLELTHAIHQIVTHFDISSPTKELELDPLITLNSKTPIHLSLKPR